MLNRNDNYVGGNDDSLAELTEYYIKQYGYTKEPVYALHYADWCGHCKRVKPIWSKIKGSGIKSKMLEVDEETSHTPGVKSYPTIIKYHKGIVTVYKGEREEFALRQWLQ